jgi:hypothetical protein
MSSRHLASGDDSERGRSVERLRAAVAERKRLDDAGESVGDGPDGIDAAVARSAADDQVAARKRWLESVDNH